ncbi:Phosphopantetheine adenylyltransferase [Galdieria sulphuraria]|nr:Phosphopantetheine adenylyltransferase [Galdieria sulphuraria]
MISSPKSTPQPISQSLPCSPLLSSSSSVRAKTCWFTLPCVFRPLSQPNGRKMHLQIPKHAVLAAVKATKRALYLYVALDAAKWPATARYILSALYSVVIESGRTRLDCKVVFHYSGKRLCVNTVSSQTQDEDLFSVAEDGEEWSSTGEEDNLGWKLEDVEYLDSIDAALTMPGDVASIRRYFRMGVAAVELPLSAEDDYVEKVVDEKVPGDWDRFVEGRNPPYEVVAVGAAWSCSRHLRIGVTGSKLLQNKQWKELIEPYEQRVAQVVEFVKSIRPHHLCVTAVELNDVEGPTIEDDIFSVNVLSLTKMGTAEKLSSTKLREMEARKKVSMERVSLS